MSAAFGIELGPEVIRAVRLARWGRSRVRTLEQHWDPTDPGEGIAGLRSRLGSVGRFAVAVDLSFLFAKQVRLPPLPVSEKRRILSLEPERFFPVRAEELVLALRGEDNLVFAARASMLEAWLAALQTIAPVELVEPAPVSLARVLGRAGSRPAVILFEEQDEGVGFAEVGAGRVRGIRRIPNDPEGLRAAVGAADRQIYLRPLNGNRGWRPASGGVMDAADELPSVAGVAPSHLAAYGAALGLGGGLSEALLPAQLARRIGRRRRRSVALAALACAGALMFALFSLDNFRARALRQVEAEIAGLRDRAEVVLALQRRGDALGREARAVATIRNARLDPAAALAALTRRLPPEAHVLALRGSGGEWQIDGYAREAAPLVARLEADPHFEDVHFLTATSRTRLGGRVYESFSIALRLVPAP